MLTCQTYEAGPILVIALEDDGDVRGERQSSLRQILYQSIETHPEPRCALDLSAVHYMASSDIGFLITLKRRIDVRQGKLVLYAVDPYIVDALRTMKLLAFFTIVDSRARALETLGAS